MVQPFFSKLTSITIRSAIIITSIASLPSICSSNLAFAGEHSIFSVFVNTGNQTFPDTLEGKGVAEVMSKNGFDIMLTSRTAGLENGDVWAVQSDTLREKGGKLQDFGVTCNFVMQKTPSVSAKGLCNVFSGVHEEEGTKTVHIVKSPEMKSNAIWYKVFEDKENKIAGYIIYRKNGGFTQ